MTAVVFVGPTLPNEAVSDCLDAKILPPVRQGDVYRVAREEPDAIGIIDGYFEGVPSVWHKEILWAIEQGIPVFGSASMGALRAAELADFGMIGVGRIFDDYYSGLLQDDDEVAVLHSPAELGFQPLSEPMVSIRATLLQAQSNGVLPPDSAAEILRHAKAMHYRQRVWTDILSPLSELQGMTAFTEWLPLGRVDAKAEDARAMLARMSDHLTEAALPPFNPVRTERTLMWKELCARVDSEQPDVDSSVLDELRLDPKLFAHMRERAALAVLSAEDAVRKDLYPERSALVRQMDDHRARFGLSRRSDLMNWIDENDLSAENYETLMAHGAIVEAAVATRAGQLDARFLSELRLSNQYTRLRDRANRKAKYKVSSDESGPDRLNVLLWYFESRLDQQVPDDLDSYAEALGLIGRDAFYELIEAEFLFCHSGTDVGTAE